MNTADFLALLKANPQQRIHVMLQSRRVLLAIC